MSHKQQPVRGRFAPSPSGLLHLGHAQTMLLCWLQVRALDGRLVLRVEDVDRGRSRPEADRALHEDLAWLGFDWDEGPDVGGAFGPYRQSERGERYLAALERLAARLFVCSCTRKEVRAASRQGGELRYSGMCRDGPTHPERSTSTRVRVEPEEVRWHDLRLGPRTEDPSTVCGDFVLRAKNDDFNYQLACVVDDIAMGITHVLRGEDLLSSTGRQILLHRWLGASPPVFAHVPLRHDAEGVRLAKRRGSAPIASLREAGEEGHVVLGRIAAELGLVPAGEGASPADLLPAFRQLFPNLLVGA